MLTADFGVCVSDLKQKAVAFGKELVTDGAMPVTVKVLIPSRDGSYPDQTLFELYSRYDACDDISYIYTGDILSDAENDGSLTGRIICGDSIYESTEELSRSIQRELEDDDWEDCEIHVFEVAEHSAGCIRGTISCYEYTKHDQGFKRTPVEAHIVVFC